MTTPRHDLLGPVHKGLRHMMSSTLSLVGTVDVDDLDSAGQAMDQLDELVDALLHHMKLEEKFILPELEAIEPGCTTQLREDHGVETRALLKLRDRADQLDIAIAEGRAYRDDLARDLYLGLADVVAETLLHFQLEERKHNPLLWARYTDDELRHLQARQIATELPEELARGVKWLLPAMTPAEREMLVGGARLSMPAPMFDGLMGLARTVLTEPQWSKLVRTLEAA